MHCVRLSSTGTAYSCLRAYGIERHSIMLYFTLKFVHYCGAFGASLDLLFNGPTPAMQPVLNLVNSVCIM